MVGKNIHTFFFQVLFSRAKLTIFQSADTSNFGVILQFKVAENVPFGGSVTSADLAAKVGLPEDVLLRSLRYAVGNGLFVETAPGVFAHSATSAAVARNQSLRDIALASTLEQAQMLLRLPETLALQQQKKEGAEVPYAAFNLVFPKYENIFECLAKEPELAMRYHLYMMGRVKTDRWSTANMVKSWDWANVGSKAIVDVSLPLPKFSLRTYSFVYAHILTPFA